MKLMPSIPKAARRAFPLVALAATWPLIASASAQASTVTIGSPLTSSFSPTNLCGTLCTSAQTALPGAVVASPSDGTIVRWRVKSAVGPGGFKLRVLHPEGFGAFTGAGTSAVGTPTSFGTQVFTTDLPIHAGDLIGLDNTNTSEAIGEAPTSGATVAIWVSALADGATAGPDGSIGSTELAFNADVQPLPGISSLKPSSGSIGGGTTVTIGGHDFTGATAVSFGGTPAAGFSVDSDGQITAVSPPGSRGTVDVSVKNPGQSPTVGTDRFEFTACAVPNLKHKALGKAKKALKRANCRLGKVKPKGQKGRQGEEPKSQAGQGAAARCQGERQVGLMPSSAWVISVIAVRSASLTG